MLNRLFIKDIASSPGPGDLRPESAQTELDGYGASAALADALADQKAESKAPIVAVLGAKGGVGATTVAINLAAALSLGRIATTIIDGNLQQPDVAHIVGKEPPHSLMELIARTPDLDRQVFDACSVALTDAHTGLSFLSPPLNGEAALKANLTELAKCLKSMRDYSHFWIIDLPRHLDKHLVTLTDMCDKIILVFEATVTGVARCQRWLSVFGELGYNRDRVICLLNRAGSKYRGVEQQLGACFDNEPIFRLPNASTVTWECSTRALLVVLAYPNHPYSRAITKLAEHVSHSVSAR